MVLEGSRRVADKVGFVTPEEPSFADEDACIPGGTPTLMSALLHSVELPTGCNLG